MAIEVTLSEFKLSLSETAPKKKWPEALQAMWYDANKDWQGAHDIVEQLHTNIGSWVHAYLHRKEGDRFNAGYWYRLARKEYPQITLKEESLEIIDFILTN